MNKRTRGRKWLSWAMGVALIIGIMLLGQWQSHREQADFDKALRNVQEGENAP